MTNTQQQAAIAQITRDARARNGVDLMAFAQALHVTYEAVRHWERQRATPNAQTYFLAAEAGGIYLEWAVKCLDVLGFLPALPALAQAAAQYQHSKDPEACHERA